MVVFLVCEKVVVVVSIGFFVISIWGIGLLVSMVSGSFWKQFMVVKIFVFVSIFFKKILVDIQCEEELCKQKVKEVDCQVSVVVGVVFGKCYVDFVSKMLLFVGIVFVGFVI